MTRATPEPIARNLASVRLRVAAAAAGRDPAAVRVLAVSKTRSIPDLEAAVAAGQREFGENYAQEALAKITALSANAGLAWHFIGALQANKTRAVAEHFDWVHTVDRQKIAQRLNEQRPMQLAPLNVCIEVNVSGEESKSGAAPGDIVALAEYISGLPRLKLRGLMTIPAPETDPHKQRQPFRRLRELYETLNQQAYGFDTLSMGMSADFEAAILEGATCVRLGTAIFGPRAPRHS
jgi:pyridoxal phosphate enzyme (YggS family)